MTNTVRALTPTATCGMAVMAKASAPGRTKTRLVPPLTFDEAAALNTAFLQDIADNVQLAGYHAGIAAYVAFAPSGSEEFFRRILPPPIGLIGACQPSLGDCLLSTSREIFARGHASAVLLNGDSPTLPTGLLIEAADVLARPGERAVLGPSSDGGYYLIGLKTVHRRLFEDIAWSTERVAAQTLERACEPRCSRSVGLVRRRRRRGFAQAQPRRRAPPPIRKRTRPAGAALSGSDGRSAGQPPGSSECSG
jgi:uncharacterized protein